MSERSDRIAQAVADAFGAAVGSAARTSWQTVSRVLEAYFSDRWLEIYVDPTVSPGIWQSGGDPLERRPWPAKTMAFQYDKQATNVLLGIWVNVDSTATGWSPIWASVPAPVDDHLVKARVSDETTVGGVLEKTVDTPTVTREVVTVDDVERVAFTAHLEGLLSDADPTDVDALSVADPGVEQEAARSDHKHDAKVYTSSPLPNGVASPGAPTDDTLIKGTHVHPIDSGPGPATDGARLYPAGIPGEQSLTARAIMAPVWRWDDVDAVGFDYAGGFDDGNSGWAETSTPGTWETTANRAMLAGELGGVDPFVGLRFLYCTRSSGGITPAQNPNYGFYVVTRVGGPSETAQFTRAADADASGDFISGKVVNCTGGVNWAGHTFLYVGNTNPTVGTTELAFADHGTSSIYKDIPNGDYGFGSLRLPVPGAICTWYKVGEGPGGTPQAPNSTTWLAGATAPGGEIEAGQRYMVPETSAFGGLYQVLAYDTSQEVIRRAPGANDADALTGLVVQINGGAGVYQNGNFTQQTATVDEIDVDATAWSAWSATNPSPPTDNLLTFAQLGQASTDILVVAQTFTGSTTLWTNPLPTLVGTPGILELPAGRETLQIGANSLWVAGWDPVTNPGDVTITAKLYKRTNDTDTLIFSSICPVKLAPTPSTTSVQWTCDLAAAVALAQTGLLSLNYEVASTCAQPVTVCMAYSRYPTWDTWVQLAGLEFALPGTDDHRRLTVESRAAPNQHPWSSISDTPAEDADGANGLIDLPDLDAWPGKKARRCRCELPTTELLGIDATGLGDLDRITILIIGGAVGTPKTLVHGQSVAEPYKPLCLPGVVVDSVMQPQESIDLEGPALCGFLYDETAGVFRLEQQPTVYSS